MLKSMKKNFIFKIFSFAGKFIDSSSKIIFDN